ncbi:Iron-sulfur clusters transporter atm1, mitochondrial [Kappamyces sp. JEL0680]|nr:Iron-sulfur clusters transporter atm1, mitochondrial [Kappamyces sp. JEL0680]
MQEMQWFFVIVYLLSTYTHLTTLRVTEFAMPQAIISFTKCVPILFLAIQVFAFGKLKDAKRVNHFITGLLFSAAGDAFLSVDHIYTDAFIFGLLAFLIAHLYYVSALTTKTPSAHWLTAALVSYGVSGVVMSLVIVPSVTESLKIPVVVYGLALSTMLYKGIDGYLAGDNGYLAPSFGCAGRWSDRQRFYASPAKPSKLDKEDWEIIKSLTRYIWPKNDNSIKARVAASLGLLVAGKLLSVSVPFCFKQVVDLLTAHSSKAALLLNSGAEELATAGDPSVNVFALVGTVLIGYGAARIASISFQELRNAVFGSVTQRAIRSAAREIFHHLLQLNSEFHLSRQTGGLVRAIDRGTKGINQVLSSVVFHIAPTIFEISVVCGILWYQFGWTYAAVTVGTMLSYTLFTVSTTQWRLSFRKQMNQADNTAASTATDSLLNVEAVQQFTNEALEARNYEKSLVKYEKAAIQSSSSLALLNAGQSAIFSLSLTIMMWMAASGVLSGAMTVGDVVMINGLVFQLAMPLNFLGSVYRDTKQSLLDMNAMFDMSHIQGKITQSLDKPSLVVKGGSIVFDNVTFGYVKERTILNNISFEIPPGKTVAFVGPSGCGKSTILRLISRYFDPDSGRITIDGQDISNVNVVSLRTALGVVPQDTILFNQTIADNIAYGKPEASFEEIKLAAFKAHLNDTIANFPHGYDTHVGERGLMISGGEKQRVQLSRIFLKDAPIALFDEPTSALDQQTESRIMKTIFDWLRQNGDQKTAVFIAHRLSTIADCDLIYVLKEGRVIESGNHQELIEQGGTYAEMWHMATLDMARLPPTDTESYLDSLGRIAHLQLSSGEMLSATGVDCVAAHLNLQGYEIESLEIQDVAQNEAQLIGELVTKLHGYFALKAKQINRVFCVGFNLLHWLNLVHFEGSFSDLSQDVYVLAQLQHCAGLETVVLRACGINDAGAMLLGTSVKALAKLRVLDLLDNEITNRGATVVAESLHHSQIRSLHLGDCPIDDGLFPALSRLVAACRSLRELDFEGCSFPGNGLGPFLETLTGNFYLTALSFTGADLSIANLASLANYLPRLHLTTLDLRWGSHRAAIEDLVLASAQSNSCLAGLFHESFDEDPRYLAMFVANRNYIYHGNEDSGASSTTGYQRIIESNRRFSRKLAMLEPLPFELYEGLYSWCGGECFTQGELAQIIRHLSGPPLLHRLAGSFDGFEFSATRWIRMIGYLHC